MRVLEKNVDLENAILYFNDDACSLCYTEKNVMDNVEAKLAGKIPVYWINAADQLNLVKKYEVLSAPSVVLIKNGRKVDQFNKYLDQDQIKTAITYYYGGLIND